jgi:hypothetical protein
LQRLAALLLFLISLIPPAASAAERPSRWRAIWRVSQGLLVGADAADAASSWGKYEGNPLLRTTQRFSYGSLAIKLGALGGGLAAQHYILRKAPEQMPLLATANLAVAGILGLVAGRNTQVPRH